MEQLLRIFKRESTLPKVTDVDTVIRQVEDPDHVVLPLDYTGQVHYRPIVQVGDTVRKGQPVAKSRSQNAIIASISGTVAEIKPVWTAQSVHSPAIIIEKNDEPEMSAEELFDGPISAGNLEEAMIRMRAAGVAPPWNLSGRDWREDDEEELGELPPIETVIITGIRQEDTILTSQLLLDQERVKVAEGLEQIGKLMPSAKLHLTAPESFSSWVKDLFGELAQLHFLPPNYFERIEREVVAKIVGRRIPNRESFREHGIAVIDVEYLLAIVDALAGTAPLTQKCLTITGTNIDTAITVRYPMGSSLEHILESLGLKVTDFTRPLIGGPMKGVAQFTDQVPVTYYNGVHLIAGDVAPFDSIAPCINCGRCTRACPVNIQVHLLNRMVEFGQLESAQGLNPEACHECGLCAYVCPAQRPIVQLINFCNHDMIHGERITWAAGGL